MTGKRLLGIKKVEMMRQRHLVILSLLLQTVDIIKSQIPYLYTTTERPCADWFERSLDICNENDVGGIIGLLSRPVNLSAPADRGCDYYAPGVSCAVSIDVGVGQKILISTGDIYRLNDISCTDCEGCDSFTLDGECVSADRNHNEFVKLLNETRVRVNFTSYNTVSGSQTRAELSFKAIGCAYRELTGQRRDVMLEEVNKTHSFTHETESYLVRASCPEGQVLPDQQAYDIIRCTKRFNPSYGYSYSWDYPRTLSCNTPRYITIIVAVVIIVILLVLIILVILCVTRTLPCLQKDDDTEALPPENEEAGTSRRNGTSYTRGGDGEEMVSLRETNGKAK